ncbi:helix-turn-helix domain-containing protein [Paenibacillus sp. 19GGS1-52]|uniref:helix-turn-helix domain-containing protein n=1 Tax=Paenibacillus sp. 19GGS1-52 TaxID=2758563 RepID=UPI001EFA3B3B|nr:helix-turn-helix domain-containing protein [Paenibacillus sp. 19GGS1-52]ULO05170.1 helix-turn-helix domain-containing protein [Paenibacillus sp. 19GGS1-52]
MNEPTSKSPAADLLLSALQELKELKFEVTVSIKPPEDPNTVNRPDRPQLDITRTEELLQPVLSATDIQKFLGIGLRQVYELLNSGVIHVARVGKRMFVSRAVFIEWLEGSDEPEVKRRR